jgi:hypothetical protein
MLGIRKANMEEVKEIKVKLPVRHLLKLHYVKLTSNKNISEVVCDALQYYFTDGDGARPAATK